jgi:hypothetical protein
VKATSDTADLARLLEFDPPAEDAAGDWVEAERKCLQLPRRFVQKCQELNEITSGLNHVSREYDQLFDYVVRNLIGIVDNVRAALAAESARDGGPDVASAKERAALEDTAAGRAPEQNAPADAAVGGLAEAPETLDGEGAANTGAVAAAPITALGLASVYRSLLSLLEELGAVPFDLLGHRYTDVAVDGQALEDPFEIAEASGTGKARDAVVREVIQDLWVLRRNGTVRVLRRGLVNC